jgi:hypothetical protein
MSEKRYFKLFSSLKKGDKTYLRLFDAIVKQSASGKEYDEKKILSLFKGEKCVNNFSVIKAYLSESILEAISVYHPQKWAADKLKQNVTHINILYDKGLFEQCKKIIERAYKLAEENQEALYMIQLTNWAERVYARQHLVTDIEKRQYDFSLTKKKYIGQLYNIAEYEDLHYKMFTLQKKMGITRKQEDIEAYKQLMKNPLMSSPDKAPSFRAKILYYGICESFYFAVSDWRKLFETSSKYVELLESQKVRQKSFNLNYIAAIHNHAIACKNIGKYELSEKVIRKLYNIQPDSEEEEVRIFTKYYRYMFSLYITTSEFKKGISLVEDFKKDIGKYENKMDPEDAIIFNVNIAILYFLSTDYSRALKWINQLLNETAPNIRNDIRAFARILNLLIHYELKNMDLLESRIIPTYRLLNKENKLYKTETLILNFFHKKILKYTGKELVAEYKILRSDMQKVIEDPLENKLLNYFDFISWIDSKIQHKPYAEIVRSK